MVPVTWTGPAIADVADIKAWIARDSQEIADAFTDRLVDATLRLGEFQTLGEECPRRVTTTSREIFFGPYRVIYVILPDEVQIATVIHGARLLDAKDVPQ